MFFYTPTYEKAKGHHAMVAAAGKRLGDNARAVWNALTGRATGESDIAEAIVLTMPEDYFPLLRGNDGIPACFAMSRLAEEISPDMSVFALRAACNTVWEKFEERRKRANDVREGLGWDLSDAWLTERDVNDPAVMDEVAAIARLAGRMYKHIRGTKVRDVDGQPEEVDSVTVGGELERLIPSEIAQLADEDLGDLTEMRLLQRRAMQFQFRGDRPALRGPLVILIDESGSMGSRAGALSAPRNQWAKACAAALTRAAHDQGRLVRVVHFSTTTSRQDIPVGDSQAIIRMMRTFLSGGTDIPIAVNRGIDEVGELELKGLRGADIVAISDGVDGGYGYEEPIKRMQSQGIKLWSIAIELEWNEHYPLRKHAERYIHVDGSLSEDAVAGLRGAADQNKE